MVFNKSFFINFFVYLFFLVFLVSDFSCVNLFADNNFGQNNFGQNNFVIKKEEKSVESKKVSKSKMQEQACQAFANQISDIANLHQKASKVQKLLIDQTGFYLESCNKSVLLRIDKKKMEEVLRVSKDFEQKMENFLKDCDKYFDYISRI